MKENPDRKKRGFMYVEKCMYVLQENSLLQQLNSLSKQLDMLVAVRYSMNPWISLSLSQHIL